MRALSSIQKRVPKLRAPRGVGEAWGRYLMFRDIWDTAVDGLWILGFLFPPLAGLLEFDDVRRIGADISQMGLPLRLMAVIVTAFALGLTLGHVLGLLTRVDVTFAVVLSAFLTMLWACLFVTVIEAISPSGGGQAEAGASLMFLIGLGILAWCLVYKLRAQAGFGNRVLVRDRSAMVLIFVATAVIVAGLVRAAGGA